MARISDFLLGTAIPMATPWRPIPPPTAREWFATALQFASARWEDGAGIFNYRDQAQKILDTMLHKNDEDNGIATNMFDPESKQVVFVPSGRNSTFTDPSYHLPAYYKLWARAAERDKGFWTDAAQASRAFFLSAANPQTGLMPDYANFDGTPADSSDHKDFWYDAWRTLSNVAVDYAWFGADPWQAQQSNRVLTFLYSQGPDSYPNKYSLDGKALLSDHSTGLTAMAPVAARGQRGDRQTVRGSAVEHGDSIRPVALPRWDALPAGDVAYQRRVSHLFPGGISMAHMGAMGDWGFKP
jgi:oligosaccharide reducing-end xylanase